jgi:hypothetical protein
MAKSWAYGVSGLSVLGLLAACSSSSGGTAGAGGDMAGSGAGASTECVAAPDAVFPMQQFGETDLIRQIAVDGDTLYFRTESVLMKAPTAGGAPETVADLSSTDPSEFWLQSDALLVRAEADLLTVPKAGGAGRALGSPLAPAPTNFANAQLDGTTLYWIASDSGSYGVYSRELSGSTSKPLYNTPDELRDLRKVADTLYFVDKDAGSIQTLPLSGGTPSKLIDADGGDDIVSADATGLYVTGTIGATTFTNFGLYRQPLNGDSETLLANELFVDVQTANNSDGAYFAAPANDSPGHSDPTDVAPSLLFAAPTDTATTVRWCIDSSFTVHALAVQGHTAYVSVYETSANKATIARVALP